jgi:hypothetical protein
MKQLTIIILSVLVLSACKKKKTTDDSTTCISGTGSTSGWHKEDMNLYYTIELPTWYGGAGYVTYQGDQFIKYSFSPTDTVMINAQYGRPGYNTNVWGPVLASSDASSVDIDYRGFTIPLKNKKRLCANGKTIGYYYYTLTKNIIDTTSKNGGLGLVYLLENNDFKQNITIDFAAEKESEALAIVSTINPK